MKAANSPERDCVKATNSPERLFVESVNYPKRSSGMCSVSPGGWLDGERTQIADIVPVERSGETAHMHMYTVYAFAYLYAYVCSQLDAICGALICCLVFLRAGSSSPWTCHVMRRCVPRVCEPCPVSQGALVFLCARDRPKQINTS